MRLHLSVLPALSDASGGACLGCLSTHDGHQTAVLRCHQWRSVAVQIEVFLASTFLHTALLQPAGLVAAAAALRHRAQPPVMNLRNLNPYVASALTDWGKVATNLAAAVPRGETNNGMFLLVALLRQLHKAGFGDCNVCKEIGTSRRSQRLEGRKAFAGMM